MDEMILTPVEQLFKSCTLLDPQTTYFYTVAVVSKAKFEWAG